MGQQIRNRPQIHDAFRNMLRREPCTTGLGLLTSARTDTVPRSRLGDIVGGVSRDDAPSEGPTYGIRLQQSIMDVLASSATTYAAIDGVLRTICEVLGWTQGSFWTVDPSTEEVRRARSWPSVSGMGSTMTEHDTDFLRRSLKGREPVWEANVTEWPGAPGETGCRLAIPVGVAPRLDGVLMFVGAGQSDFGCELDESFHAVSAFLGDFLERRRAQDAARCSREALNAAIHHAMDVVVVVRPDATLAYGSPSIRNVLGVEPGRLKRASLGELVHEEDRARVLRAIGDAMRGVSRFVEARFLHQDGSSRTLEIIGTRIELPNEGACVLLNTRDVTTRKQAERVLIEATREALEAARLKSEFVNNVSHELRTPLNGIFGMLEMLTDTPLDEEQTEYAQGALRSSHALLALVDDLLDFSHLEAGRCRIERVSTDARSFVRELVTAITPAATAKGLKITFSVGDDVPQLVVIDPERLRQVLAKLLSNAIKFTDSGHICLDVGTSPVGRRPLIRFSVHDTGIGLRREHFDLAFERFAQIDGSMTRRHGGTGLGLAIAKQLIEIMGGEVGVESKPHLGSTFWVALPLHVPTSGTAPAV